MSGDNVHSVVVLVHGLWNRGWCMELMARRLRARGHSVKTFSYPSRAHGLRRQAADLCSFVDSLGAGRLDLVGHSMGGLVILKMLQRFGNLPPGRVVLLGSPVRGSSVMARLENLPGRDVLFGGARSSLRGGFSAAPAGRETGVISGTRAFGLGRLTGEHDEPSDGTVLVSETHLQGARDSIELPVCHSEMLVSPAVARQTGYFLRHGKFRRAV